MVNGKTLDKYEATIGIECHVQLKTKSKLFSGAGNDARKAEPNMLVSPICFGLPGTLPVLNEAAIELAVRAGIALNAEIARYSKFDRKHYFYPDLPMGYQITQYDEPIVGKGHVAISLGGKDIRVRINRAHMEADAGKSTHPPGADYSLVDLNRAMTPLLEIVSEPDMHTPAQARAYARELYLLMKYSDVSDVDLYHGNMRFDVNISVAPKGSDELGLRTEIKNLNSFRSVEKASEYEFKRQVELLEKGQSVTQETRGWDDSKMKTFTQRSKEEAHDYRYFPDPDLPPIELDDSFIEKIKSKMPKLPPEIRKTLHGAGVDKGQAETILSNSRFADIMLLAVEELKDKTHIKRLANWLTVDVQAILQAEGTEELKLSFAQLERLAELVDEGALSSTGAKQVLAKIMNDGGDPRSVAEESNLIQMSDASELEAVVDETIEENASAAEDVRNGETKAIGFLVGQVMKKTRGQANPQAAQQIIKDKLTGGEDGS